MPPSEVSARRAAERWFLDRGLPSVVTQRARMRAVWPRSAPALAGFAVIALCVAAIYLLTGSTEIDVDGEPTLKEWVVLAILALAIPLTVLAGWLVARMATNRAQTISAVMSVAVGVVSAAIQRDLEFLVTTGVVVAIVLAATASGIGSVLGWAVKLTLSQFAAIGDLLVGALPVVLLTVLVFFNSPVWAMASTISRARLWLALAFLLLIAATFVVSGLLKRVESTLQSTAGPVGLSWLERFNVIFVLAASQIAQILTVAIVTAGIFLVLGLIVLSPELLAQWTHNGPSDGTVFGMTIPVPEALIQVSLFLAALTFMYISARAVADVEYRGRFLDPLIDDLKVTLLARNRYWAGTLPPTGPMEESLPT
ncbi:hypothetical protein CIW52_17840 [Mycolicibacterium sp. P9-64]|uniref:hypothetical protein n=1 Tax=Mycolicibacterium sp. P9-64 TaxID=2024612 RepID=UPI0011EE99DE|nr:hypothetical protein [Mycolicibacterium sp. P9-64]KAA0081624.1 hypothetical protein CIW52_17840 [Mycolicibacterium sp. P9-64]